MNKTDSTNMLDDVAASACYAITVYPYREAPKHLADLSTNGGDEDWLAIIPPNLVDDWIPWMDEGTAFGCCHVNTYDHPDRNGWKVRIGCHA